MADMDVTARFKADISDMKSKMAQVEKSLDGIQRSTKNASGGFTVLKGALGTAFGGAIVGGIYAAGRAMTDFVGGAMQAAAESEMTVKRLDQIASSMGVLDTVLGGSTQRLQDYAQTLQDQTGVNDETIKSAQALILTFKDVAATAGEQGGVFDRTTVAAMDLAAAGFGGIEQNAKSLARALQDPAKGLTMLGRQGVTFTEAEKELILSLQESGRTLEAQNLILQAVEKQVGGTAGAVATDADKMKAAFADLQEGIGLALFPVIQELAATLTPVIKELQGPLQQVASVVAGALGQAFQALAPILPPLATALASIGQALTTALAGALQSIIPALIPVAQNLGNLATQIAPLLADVVGRLGEIFGRLLGAITPLLGPLTDLVMGILDAAWPIIEIVADVLLMLVDALTPVLDAVMALLQPLGELIQVVLAALMPVLKPILPVIEALANVLGTVLVKAVGLIMAGLGGLILGLSKIAPFVARNVVKPVVTNFLNMAKGVVGAAADMLGWVPGLGDSLKQAESAISQFAVETEANISAAGDAIAAEGERIGNEMITQGTNALNAAGPALGAAARQTGAYVAGQYNYALASGMGKAWDYMNADGAKPAALPPPPPSPTPAPSPSGSSSGASAASKQEEKRKQEIQKFIDGFERAIERIKTGQEALAQSTRRTGSEFAQVLGDMLPQSEIQDAFGPTGSVGSVIAQYDQLDAAITDLYKPLMNAKRFGKAAAQTARGLMNDAKGFLKAATQTALELMKAKDANIKAIEQADKDYETAVAGINRNFDALDKAAAANIASIEARFDALIPGLERALESATDAFNRENAVLQDLIKERDGFLTSMASSARSFLNSLSFPLKKADKAVKEAIPTETMRREIREYANGLRVTIETEIEPAMQDLSEATGEEALRASDIRDALNDRLQSIREFSTNIRSLIARGLDPTLVQEFVSAGVSGAGEAVAALVQGTDDDLQAINAAQAGLASEVANFQAYAAQQWFDAGIAQQEAIVAPLAAARDQAQAALTAANAARTAEIAAARAHAEQLKIDRQIALDEAKAQYEAQKLALQQQGKEIDDALTANANNLHNQIAALQETVPPEMFKAGRKSIDRMLAGFREDFPGMKRNLNNMMDRLAASMNRTATVTIRTVYESVNLPGRAMGGPVAAQKAYVVGERGPEVFVPGVSGNIIPNNMLGGLGSVPPMSGGRGAGVANVTNISINVQTGLATDPAETGRQVVEAIRKYERRSGPVFVSA